MDIKEKIITIVWEECSEKKKRKQDDRVQMQDGIHCTETRFKKSITFLIHHFEFRQFF